MLVPSVKRSAVHWVKRSNVPAHAAAVTCGGVCGAVPQHDPAVVGRALHRRQHLPPQRARVDVPAVRRALPRREAQEDVP